MKIELNIKDKNKFNELYNQKLLNMTIDDMYNEFLFYFDVREANKYKNVSEYFNNYFDLDSEDITVINQYNSNNFKLLNINDYLENQKKPLNRKKIVYLFLFNQFGITF